MRRPLYAELMPRFDTARSVASSCRLPTRPRRPRMGRDKHQRRIVKPTPQFVPLFVEHARLPGMAGDVARRAQLYVALKRRCWDRRPDNNEWPGVPESTRRRATTRFSPQSNRAVVPRATALRLYRRDHRRPSRRRWQRQGAALATDRAALHGRPADPRLRPWDCRKFVDRKTEFPVPEIQHGVCRKIGARWRAGKPPTEDKACGKAST